MLPDIAQHCPTNIFGENDALESLSYEVQQCFLLVNSLKLYAACQGIFYLWNCTCELQMPAANVTPKGLFVPIRNKPVLGRVTWSHFNFRFCETFYEHASWNTLCRSINFIIFGPTDQELWRIKKFRRSLGRVGKCCSQSIRVDYINPKRWAQKIRRFEKSPLRVSSPYFWTLSLHLGGWNLPFFMEPFFPFLLKLEFNRTFVSTVGIVA